MLFAGEDTVELKDDFDFIETSFKSIIDLYCSLSNIDSNIGNYVLNEIFKKKYNECKNIFGRIDFII